MIVGKNDDISIEIPDDSKEYSNDTYGYHMDPPSMLAASKMQKIVVGRNSKKESWLEELESAYSSNPNDDIREISLIVDQPLGYAARNDSGSLLFLLLFKEGDESVKRVDLRASKFTDANTENVGLKSDSRSVAISLKDFLASGLETP